MGVPRFFRWVSERYPLINREIRDETVPEIDNLYLDMNGIIHRCSHGDTPETGFDEDRCMVAIFQYIDRLFDMIKPRKHFFMAVDGVAPRAKMNQQRQRRFKSALERKLAMERHAVERERNQGEDAESLDQVLEFFDSNAITPGTHFMARLSKHLDYFIHKKVAEDRRWQACHVILSGHDVPGEGEHKIMDFLRARKCQPNYEPNERHCLYGLDADLIMLSLASHEPHFVLLREEVTFGNKFVKPLKGGTDADLRREIRDETKFHLLHINILREYLELEFEHLELPFPFDLERVIDDFVLMCYFMGNDFLPSLPTFNIGEGSLNDLFDMYRESLPELGGYLTDGVRPDFDRIERFLSGCQDSETEQLKRKAQDLRWIENKTTVSFETREKKEDLEALQLTGDTDDDEDAVFELLATDQGEKEPAPAEWSSVSRRQKKPAPSVEELRRLYYQKKLHVEDPDNDTQLKPVLRSYLEGIQWVLSYYYEGVPSWSWYYPYHFAPLVCDLQNLRAIAEEVSFADPGAPFPPFVQLMGVLPPASAHLVPAPIADLMLDKSSPIAPFYPLTFEVDRDPAKPEWEHHVLIPFVDEATLLGVFRTRVETQLTEEERSRNKFGRTRLYRYNTQKKVSISVAALPPLTNVPCEVVEFKQVSHQNKFIPKVPKGCLVGKQSPPGFPSLFVFDNVTSSLEALKINLFGTPSRKVTRVITLEEDASPPELLDLTTVLPMLIDSATQQQFKRVFVDYPFLTEAEIESVSDAQMICEVVNLGVGQQQAVKLRPLSEEEKDRFAMRAREVAQFYLNKRAIDVSPVTVLVSVRKFVGMSRNLRGHTFKLFAETPAEFPFQLVLHAHVPRQPVTHREGAPDSLERQFPVGLDVVCLYPPFYGAVGRILGQQPRSTSVDVELHILNYKNAQLVLENVRPASTRVRWYAAGEISGILRMHPAIVGQLTSSVRLNNGKEVGLEIRMAKKQLIVSGWSRMDPQTDRWEYSRFTLDALREYKSRYPSLLAAMETALQDYNDSGRDKKRPLLSPKDVFPGAENPEQAVEGLLAWLQTVKSANSVLVPSSSQRLLDEEMQDVLAFAKQMSEARRDAQTIRVVLHKVSPVLLYAPHHGVSPHGTTEELLRRAFRLGDRVVCMKTSGAVPFGLTGTVVELRFAQGTADVVFDESFMLAKSLQTSDSEVRERGQSIPLTSLLNLSKQLSRYAQVEPVVERTEPVLAHEWLVHHTPSMVRTDVLKLFGAGGSGGGGSRASDMQPQERGAAQNKNFFRSVAGGVGPSVSASAWKQAVPAKAQPIAVSQQQQQQQQKEKKGKNEGQAKPASRVETKVAGPSDASSLPAAPVAPALPAAVSGPSARVMTEEELLAQLNIK